MAQVKAHCVLTEADLRTAVYDYIIKYKIATNVQDVAFSGDGKPTARVTVIIGEPPPPGRDPRD